MLVVVGEDDGDQEAAPCIVKWLIVNSYLYSLERSESIKKMSKRKMRLIYKFYSGLSREHDWEILSI